MNFEFDEAQSLVRETARKISDNLLSPRAAERDRTAAFPTEELAQLAELGLCGITLPESLGGAGADTVSYSAAIEEISRGDASVAVAVSVCNMVGEVLCRFGTPDQQQQFVPLITSGKALGSFALSESHAGSDPASMTTRAIKTENGYRIDGSKLWITSGDRAGVLIVWAKTDVTAGGKGISAFVISGDTAGLRAGRSEAKMGLNGSSTVPLVFDGCEVPRSALLGQEGGGLAVALTALDGGRIGIASQAIGLARAALEATLKYVVERQQFGKYLSHFQATQFKLADMATQIEAARALTRRAAWLKQNGRAFSTQAAMAKLYATEMAGRVCDAAVQLHGGYGYTRDFPVERYYRDVRVSRIYEGTSEIQRLVIGRSLMK